MQSLPKSLFLIVFCVPLAIVFGVLLATPLDPTTMFVVSTAFVVLLLPFLIKAHHTILILSWNAFVNAFFLPGKPYFWMLMTAITLVLIVLSKMLNRAKVKLIWVPWVAVPLIIMGIISYITAELTGGVGVRAVGSETYGGKRYIYQWAAIAGFFALSALPVDPRKRQFLAGGFYLMGVTAVISNIGYMLGENFYFLFLLFPVEWAIAQVAAENLVGGFMRIGGLSPASLAAISFLLVRYGLRGIFNLRYPWRAFFFLLSVAAGMFSGFRVTLVVMALLLGLQFLAEGLHKTKFLFVAIFSFVIVSAAVLPFANRLPLAVQRCLTLFPLELDAAAVENARGSMDWRLEMWRALLPDIPKYFWLGKGYALDPKDLYFSQVQISRRFDAQYEGSMVAGDYHNGPLTLIIPFGIWGVLAFVAFVIGALRVLWRNYKYGDPEIININRFNLVAFVGHLIFFIAVFGAFYLDIAKFVGIVGLSVAINRGVAGRVSAPVTVVESEPETIEEMPVGGRLQPAFRPGRA
jgi:hypothetical protein